MYRFICSIILIISLNNCSFDNKTGIWNDQKNITKTENFSELKSLDINKKSNLRRSIVKKDNLLLSSLKKNKNWSDPFLNNFNNTSNISFTENEIYNLSKSRKKIKVKLKMH